MNPFRNIVFLAVLQGITEFLPVSSSGHLVLAKTFLNFNGGAGALLELTLHSGTLFAILIFYRHRIFRLLRSTFSRDDASGRAYLLLLLLGVLPALLVYLAVGKTLESLFSNPAAAAGALIATGLYLVSTLWIDRVPARPPRKFTPLRALATGIAQAVALAPGISRSGATIVTARHLGIAGEKAAEFSFLTALPLFAGATMLAGIRWTNGNGAPDLSAGLLVTGFAVAAITGLVAIRLLLWAMSRRLLPFFGVYCILAGVAALLAL